MTTPTSSPTSGLKRSLGIPAATAIVAGAMLGIGIFIIPPEVASLTHHVGVFFGLWLVEGIAFAGADAFAELRAAYPSSGGDFRFQQEAFGPSIAFCDRMRPLYRRFWWLYRVGRSSNLGVSNLEHFRTRFSDTAFSIGELQCSRAQLGAVFLVLVYPHQFVSGSELVEIADHSDHHSLGAVDGFSDLYPGL